VSQPKAWTREYTERLGRIARGEFDDEPADSEDATMILCDCPACPCWFPAWETGGESRCFDCSSGKHNWLEAAA